MLNKPDAEVKWNEETGEAIGVSATMEDETAGAGEGEEKKRSASCHGKRQSMRSSGIRLIFLNIAYKSAPLPGRCAFSRTRSITSKTRTRVQISGGLLQVG